MMPSFSHERNIRLGQLNRMFFS